MFTTCLSLLHLCTVTAVIIQAPDRVFYWNIKPFVIINSNTKLDDEESFPGILKFTYKELSNRCNLSLPLEELADFRPINYTEKQFYEMLENTNDSEIQNGDNRIWFPLFLKLNKAKLAGKYLKAEIFINSPKVAIIVNKEKITLINKVIEAVKLSTPIVTIAGVFILLFSILLWLAECITNKDFSKCFIHGFCTSLWWSIVTLATVGYGDIVPKSFIGRFIAVVWMMIGVLVISALTGTFTSIITNNSFLNIQGKKVAALNNSIDFEVSRKSYNTTLKGFKSYDEMLQAVNDKKNETEYGVINIDVLLNMEFKIKYPNVCLVKIIDAVTPVFIVYGNKTNLMRNGDDFADCIKRNIKDIKEKAQEVSGKIPLIDTETPQNLFDSILTSSMLYPVIITLCVLFAFVMKDVVQFAYKKRYGKDVPLTVFFKGNKSDEKKLKDKNLPLTVIPNSNKKDEPTFEDDFFEELTRIEENIINLKTKYGEKNVYKFNI